MPTDHPASETPSVPSIRITLPAILDDRSASRLQNRVDRVLGDSPEVVVLDCTDVRFVDSGGLRLLLSATRTGEDYGTRVVIYDPAGALDHLRRIVDIEGELIFETTLDQP